MIPIPSGVRVWIATGHTDMRRGMRSLALTVQEILKRAPHAGDLYIFRGRRGDLVKILWLDGLGMSRQVHLARGVGRRGIDLSGADGLYARGHRLAESAIELATAECRLNEEICCCRHFWGVPTRSICDSLRRMDADRDAVPDEVSALKKALAVERARGLEIAAELAVAARKRRKTRR